MKKVLVLLLPMLLGVFAASAQIDLDALMKSIYSAYGAEEKGMVIKYYPVGQPRVRTLYVFELDKAATDDFADRVTDITRAIQGAKLWKHGDGWAFRNGQNRLMFSATYDVPGYYITVSELDYSANRRVLEYEIEEK